MKARAWVAALGAAWALAAGCSGAQAPGEDGDALIDDGRLALGVHRFWSADVPIASPDALAFDPDAEPRWVAHVRDGVAYELWPGGVRVNSERARWGVRVHGLEGDRVRFAAHDGRFVYFPAVERGALRDLVTNQPALVYGADGVPFAQIQRAIEVAPAAGGVSDDRLVHVCLGGEACWGKGYVMRASLGDVIPIRAELDALRPPDARPEVLDTITLVDDTERTVFDASGRPRASATFEALDVLTRGDAWSEVVAYKDGVHLNGFMPADEVTELEKDMTGVLGGLGMGSSGLGVGSAPAELLRIARGTWVYGAPAAAARFGRLDRDSTTLRALGSDARGWSAAELHTPWGRYTVYVRDEDVVERVVPE
jgi:hypothetical protein